EILLTENGTFAIGSALDDNGVATGKAEKLTNIGGLIGLNGSGKISVKTLSNENKNFKTEEYLADEKKGIVEFYLAGQVDPFWTNEDGGTWWHDDRGVHFYDKNGVEQLEPDIDYNNVESVTKKEYTRQIYLERPTINEPARIHISGDLIADGDNWTNTNSQILVGGAIIYQGKLKDKPNDKKIENIETLATKRIVEKGYSARGDEHKKNRLRHEITGFKNDYQPINTEDKPNYRFGDLPDVEYFEVKQNTAPKLTQKPLDLVNLSSVFKIDLQDAKQGQAKPYLVETDPRFTNYKDWLSGNYMLDRLVPDNLMKRIGDGYYEQRLINEQVAMLTGYRYLGGFASDEEQFKALMDNGIAVADDLQLTVGIKLTKDQVNRLTQDIVWYEKQTVTLPNGESQEVLVPQVYLAKAGNSSVILSEAKNLNDTAKGATIGSGSLNATNGEQKQRYYTQKDGTTIRTNGKVEMKDGEIVGIKSDGDLMIETADMTEAQQNYRYATGSVISANTMDLTDIGELNNTGTIQAKEYIHIDGKKINNSGSLNSDIVRANADEINITGGDVTANRAVLLNADKVNIASTTSTNKDGTTVLNQVAQIKLTDKNDNGLILINADDKLTTKAAHIENNAQNGQTVLTAKEIDLGTITLAHKEKFGEATDKNHRIVETTQEVGSNIQGKGDIKIVASDKLTGTALNVDSQNGKAVLYGENSVDIKEGRQTLYLDEAYESKDKGLLSSKTTTAHIQRNDNEAIHSNITGDKVEISSKGDITLTGTNAVSDSGTVVYSENGDISIQAAQNFYNTEEERTVKKSGLLGTGGIGFTVGKQKSITESDNTALIHSGSMVGSLGGDTSIYAGGNYEQIGSNVVSMFGDVDISAKDIQVKSAENKIGSNFKQKQEQSGLTIALTGGVISMAESVANHAKAVTNSDNNGRVRSLNALSAYAKGSQLLDAAEHIYNSQPTENPSAAAAASGIRLSVSLGNSKSEMQSSSAVVENQSSVIKSGGDVRLTARDENINIQGSKVQA
ncbi:MAG: S-layer family protein, partial [Neisseriaceae bacterium]|nr:S-layer family protein [Neisseriaceae bacterium]